MSEEPTRPFLPFSKAWPLVMGASAGVLLRFVFFGSAGKAYAPMMASFIYLAPLLVGAVTIYAAERQRRRSWAYYFGAAFLANTLFVLGTLVIMIEGLICAILIAPLFGILGGLGGLAMGAICRWTNWPRQAVFSIALIPLLLGGVEQQVTLPNQIQELRLTRVVEANSTQIWAQLNDARDIRSDEVERAWMYKIGVPLPSSGITEDTAQGAHVRHVRMGKGIRFDQIAADWQPLRRVRWIYRFAPDSFPPHALDDHVMIGGQYFDILDTEYELSPRGPSTELSIRMRYRVSTRFNWYAEPIARLLVSNLEQVFLEFYARRAELAARQG